MRRHPAPRQRPESFLRASQNQPTSSVRRADLANPRNNFGFAKRPSRTASDTLQRLARGALFETWVVSENLKQRFNAGQPADLYFWRDSSGHEVDLLEERGQGLHASEIKSGATFSLDWLNGLRQWKTMAAEQTGVPTLIYGGDTSFERHQCQVLSWRDLTS